MQSSKEVEITPVKYGESVLSEKQIFENGAEDIIYPILFQIYLIRYEKRLILIDAGCETMPEFEMKAFLGSVNALKKMGILPETITDVAVTHAHHDHIECVKYFENAVIYMQRDEYEEGSTHLMSKQKVQIFEDSFNICEKIKIQKIGGHTKGSCIVEISKGTEKTVIVGDECYLRKNIERKIATGTSYCPEKSRKFIEKYSNGKYKLLLCHDK